MKSNLGLWQHRCILINISKKKTSQTSTFFIGFWIWLVGRRFLRFCYKNDINIIAVMLLPNAAKRIIRPCRRFALYWARSPFILHFTRWHLNELKLPRFKLHGVRNRDAKSKIPFANLSKVIIKWSAVAQKWLKKKEKKTAWFMSVCNWMRKERVTSTEPERRPIRGEILSDTRDVEELFPSITNY